jgi:hypothetical protein
MVTREPARFRSNSVISSQQQVATANSATELAQATGNPAHVHTAVLAQQDAQTALAQLDSEGDRAAATVAAANREASGVFPDGLLRSTITGRANR